MSLSRSIAENRMDADITIDGLKVPARIGEPLAAVFLRLADIATRESPISGEKRAPYCMMGVCYECLVVIDGVANLRSCQEPVRPGMRVSRQQALRRLGE